MLLIPGSIALNSVYRCESLPAAGDSVQGTAARELGALGAVSAVAAGRAGADVRLVAAAGSGPAAESLLGLLDNQPMDSVLHRLEGVETGTAASIVDDAAHFTQVWTGAANALLTRDHIAPAHFDGVTTLLCHLDSNRQTTHYALHEARARDIRRVLHVSPVAREPLEWLVNTADVLVTDDRGLSELVRQLHPAGQGDFTGEQLHALSDARLHALCRATTGATLVVRLGGRGAFVSEAPGGRLLTAPPGSPGPRGCLCDAACFAGVIAAWLDAGRDPREATRAALAATALLFAARGGVGALPDGATIAKALGDDAG